MADVEQGQGDAPTGAEGAGEHGADPAEHAADGYGGGHGHVSEYAKEVAQFEILEVLPINIAGLNLSFTNSSFWMALTVVLAFGIMGLGARRAAIVPGRMQAFAEMLYEIVANMLRDNVGKEGQRYFPYIFTLFMFVLCANLLGMIPGSFAVTSHIIVTFALAITVFTVVTIVGFLRHGAGYFRMLFPHGAPLWTAVILVPIELISYLSRPISLSVRLFANMTAGHVMMKVIAGFVVSLGWVFGVVPLLGLVAITGLEFMIAVIQAYVFAILSCIYLHDAIHMH